MIFQIISASNSSGNKPIIGSKLTDCDVLIKQAGQYRVKIAEMLMDKECRIYILSENVRTFVSLKYDNGNIQCNDNEYVGYYDGWYWYDQYFPVKRDRQHVKRDQDKTICHKNRQVNKNPVWMSQNAGQIYYRIQKVNTGFDFTVQFKPQESENIVLSLYILQPPFLIRTFEGMMMKILTLDVGDYSKNRQPGKWPSPCDKSGRNNYVQIGGYLGEPESPLDELQVYYDVCNENSFNHQFPIICPNIVVRMVVRKLLTQIIEFQFRPMSTMEVFKTLHSEPLRLTCSKHSSTKFPTIPMPVIDLFDDKPYTEDDDYCHHLLKEEGYYFMRVDGLTFRRECAVFLLAPPRFLIEVEMVQIHLPQLFSCDYYGKGKTHLDFFDGWDYHREYIPNDEHSKKTFRQRMETTCAYVIGQEFGFNKQKKIFRSSQNIAQLLYLYEHPTITIIDTKLGFYFHVRFIFDPYPCNTVVHLIATTDGYLPTYLVQNNNVKHPTNCSIYLVESPWERTKITGILLNFIDYDIGNFPKPLRTKRYSQKYDEQCTGLSLEDYAEVDGGLVFGFVTHIKPSKYQWCTDVKTNQSFDVVLNGCRSSVIHLVSSGKSHNSVVFNVQPLWIRDPTKHPEPDRFVHLNLFNMSLCNGLITKPGYYYYRETKQTFEECRTTVLADRFTLIDLSFFKVDFKCDDNQYVNLVDGILFKKRYWPQTGVDHSSKDDEDRIHHVCQGRPKKIRTEQNAAQIHFRLKVNQGFLFHVNFEKQPLPLCHTIIPAGEQNNEEVYRLQSVNGDKPCSITLALLPYIKTNSSIRAMVITIMQSKFDNVEELFSIESHKICMHDKRLCTAKNLPNYALIGGQNDAIQNERLSRKGLEYCLPIPYPPLDFLVAECDVITIRLISRQNDDNNNNHNEKNKNNDVNRNWIDLKFAIQQKLVPEPRIPFDDYILYQFNCTYLLRMGNYVPNWHNDKIGKYDDDHQL
ncbi:hypothetical protein HUG17_6002 [Dermatophagoides farinae]|uniref:Corticotropin-releasing factor binding protein N-terminal domain-containing protein n=1 Tax=Dermatophagoides farinae TaxID=6954 RepID=A0A9D4P5U0_DERFA|nr:hypothetical protein HUG17_6002 [Dermatophagoides farinae]